MLDAGSSLCKPLGEIAVDEIWIKLHLTKVSLVQSVNLILWKEKCILRELAYIFGDLGRSWINFKDLGSKEKILSGS